MENEKIIGRRIAELRKKNGMTQQDLAEKFPVTLQAVSKWERGESLPDLAKLADLAKIFNVPLNYFVDELYEETPPQSGDAAAYANAAHEPAQVLIGVCKECGKGIYDEEEIAQTSPAMVCKSCHERKLADNIKAAEAMRQRREALEEETLKKQRLHEIYVKQSAKTMRNKGLITAGVICGVILILLIIGIVQEPTEVGAAIAGYCIVTFFLFPFIAQLFWHGTIVDVCLCGGKLLGGVGVIFTLDLDGIIFLILFKLVFWVIKVLFFLLTLVFFALVAMFMSPFTFIPAVVKLSKGKLPE